MADRTVILHDGTIEADGAAVELWNRPPTAFAARFLGFRNVVTGRLRRSWYRDALGSAAATG